MEAIVCQELTRRYGAVTGLDGLNMIVPEGRVFGFLGPNGAGKSTTLRILATLTHPTTGDAWIAGASIRSKADRIRHALGYMPQELAFPGWMRGQDFLEYAAALSEVPSGERRARAAEMLDFVGLTGAAKRRIRGYSGGMKGRLGLAQALIHRPAVALLDEPAATLDPLGRRDILQLIAGLRNTTTVVLSSHILDDIDRVCDEVAILDGGRLIAQDTTVGLKDRYVQPAFAVEVAEDPAPLIRTLAAQPWVAEVSAAGSAVQVRARSRIQAERGLPRLVLDAGYTLLRYEPVAPSLEDVFVRLIRPTREEA